MFMPMGRLGALFMMIVLLLSGCFLSGCSENKTAKVEPTRVVIAPTVPEVQPPRERRTSDRNKRRIERREAEAAPNRSICFPWGRIDQVTGKSLGDC